MTRLLALGRTLLVQNVVIEAFGCFLVLQNFMYFINMCFVIHSTIRWSDNWWCCVAKHVSKKHIKFCRARKTNLRIHFVKLILLSMCQLIVVFCENKLCDIKFMCLPEHVFHISNCTYVITLFYMLYSKITSLL